MRRAVADRDTDERALTACRMRRAGASFAEVAEATGLTETYARASVSRIRRADEACAGRDLGEYYGTLPRR